MNIKTSAYTKNKRSVLVSTVRGCCWALLALMLIACGGHKLPAQYQASEYDPSSLAGLQSLKLTRVPEKKQQVTSSLRYEAMRETALSLGARAGLSAKARAITQMLEQKGKNLATIYNFNRLILKNSVLPPVILEGRSNLHQHNARTLRLSDKTYSIIKQAQFITTPPTWRDYLAMHFPPPEKPHDMLLPKNAEEHAAWSEALAEGWQKGEKQALDIYHENLARLKRDFEGMLLYKTLLAQKMVSPPRVARRALGVTGGGDSLSVNDRTLTITADPALNPDTKQWKPVM